MLCDFTWEGQSLETTTNEENCYKKSYLKARKLFTLKFFFQENKLV